LRSADIEAERVQCDVASRASVENAARATIAKFGQVHVVCNNAGVGMGGPLGTVSEADWEWVIRVNLMGVVHGTEIFAPLIARHGEGGHIVNISSIAGLLASPTMEPYAATKFAVVAMSEGWRQQLAPQRIGVSVVCPGFVRTSIGTGHRNKPGGPQRSAGAARASRATAADAPGGSPAGPERASVLDQLIAGGMDPQMVAARVLEAIRDDELYVFTHPELKGAVETRFTAILEAFDRAARSPALADHVPQDLSSIGLAPPAAAAK
jgi:NAD(P)-dependent dehydrogenase (short-subunit alcohol dehydrogenase family)